MTLRNQFFLLLCAQFAAVLAVTFAVSMAGTREYLELQLASHAQETATAISLSLASREPAPELAELQVTSLFASGYFKSIDVLAADGHNLVHRASPEKIEGVPLWFVHSLVLQAPVGEALLVIGGRESGMVRVVSQPTFAYQHLWGNSLEMIKWLLVVYAAALALAYAMLHYIIQPLRAIEKMAIDVQGKRFGQIEQLPRASELARVVSAMNQMSARVREMLDAEIAKVATLHRQAYEDDATGLLNRRGFELHLGNLLQGEYQFGLGAMIAVELDDMRMVSREYGFSECLKIMQVLVMCARSVFGNLPVAILARSNEHSFSIVVTDALRQEVVAMATDMRERFMQSLAGSEPAKLIMVNTGVAFFRQQDQRSDVFSRADLAVESARQLSRNGFYVLDDQPDERNSLGSFGWRVLIRTALAENRWRLLRQPVVRLAQPGMLQSECMARLVDADGQLVPAAKFMPMAVRHKLMPEIDRALVSLAFHYLHSAPAADGTVAINLSPQSMVDSEFMDWFNLQLSMLGQDARRLAIEITEFGALRDVAAATRVRDMVRRYGAKFGIDHFGLDLQALKLLRELLPDYVKLTGSLMLELDTLTTVNAMLSSFVSLAHSLDIVVIAQQVERAEQLQLLSAAKVDAAQGYYFGAPQ